MGAYSVFGHQSNAFLTRLKFISTFSVLFFFVPIHSLYIMHDELIALIQTDRQHAYEMLFILIVLFSSFDFYSYCTPFAKIFTFIYEFSIIFVFKSINGIMNTVKHLTIMHKLPLIKLLTIPKKLTLSLYKLSIVFNQNIQCMTDL